MPPAAPSIGTVDDLLIRVCEAAQLPPNLHQLACAKYRDVAKWLFEARHNMKSADDVFTQGSMRLRTTVRPTTQEFDIDLVAAHRMDPDKVHARDLYQHVAKRLGEHPDFKSRLKRPEHRRCMTLDYPEHEFHLDVVPALFDRSDPDGKRILIPCKDDWETAESPEDTWMLSEPLRYAEWFADKTTTLTLIEEGRRAQASVEPAPPYQPAATKEPLRNVVQLIKANRDIVFGTGPAPSSILLTTLAGEEYRGQESVSVALHKVVHAIDDRIKGAESRTKVMNPVEKDENLVDRLDLDTYTRMGVMFSDLATSIDALIAKQFMVDILPYLGQNFGEGRMKLVAESAGEAVRGAHESGKLKQTAAGSPFVITEPKAERTVAPNTWHC